jgi:hypothetical protein
LRRDGAPRVRKVVRQAGDGKRVDAARDLDQHVIGEGNAHGLGDGTAELRSGRGLQAEGSTWRIGAAGVGEASSAMVTATA